MARSGMKYFRRNGSGDLGKVSGQVVPGSFIPGAPGSARCRRKHDDLGRADARLLEAIGKLAGWCLEKKTGGLLAVEGEIGRVEAGDASGKAGGVGGLGRSEEGWVG